MELTIFVLPGINRNNKYFDLLYNEFSRQINILRYKDFFNFITDILFSKITYKRENKKVIHFHMASDVYGSQYRIKTIIILFTIALFLPIYRLLFNFKFIWTMHNNKAHDYPHPFLDNLGRKLFWFLSNKVLVQQNNYNDKTQNKHQKEKLSYLPHPSYENIYGPRIKSKERKMRIRERLGYDKNDLIFLCFGMLRPYKKIDEVIKAFNHTDRKKLNLLIAGSGKKNYVKKLKGQKKDENIKIIDKFIQDRKIPQLFAIANYSIFYYDETTLSSGSVILSISYYTPVVARKSPAVRDIFKYNFCSIFEDTNSLIDLLQNVNKPNSSINKNIEAYLDHISPKKIQNKLLSIYRNV